MTSPEPTAGDAELAALDDTDSDDEFGDVDFSFLDEADTTPTPEVKPTSQPEVKVEAEPQAPTQGDPAQSAKPEATAPTQPQQPTEPAAPVQGEPVAQPQTSHQELVKKYEAWRDQAIDTLATTSFGLDEETANLIDTDPGKAIPKLMAKVYIAAVENSVATIQSMLPQALARHTQSQAAEGEAEKAFFTKWPVLEGHREEVLRVANVYRQHNPRASQEQFILDVGAMVMTQKGLPMQGAPAYSAPMQQTPPHRPAAVTPPRSVAQTPTNPFAEMATHSLDFDDD